MQLGVTSNGAARAALAACGALAFGLSAAQSARAQDPLNLRDVLFGAFRRDDRSVSLPPVARYRGEAGERFVLDRSPGERMGGAALLRFEDSPEIWVLRPTAGPRGDVIYRNDMGDPVLRSMRVGGLTLYTGGRPEGVAAAMAGPASNLRPSFVGGPAQLLQSLVQASARASRAAQHLIAFDAPDYTPGTEPVFADAAMLTAEAFVLVAGRVGRERVARYVLVRFAPGLVPNAAVAGREVRITVTPGAGIAGRPSSKRIAAVIAQR